MPGAPERSFYGPDRRRRRRTRRHPTTALPISSLGLVHGTFRMPAEFVPHRREHAAGELRFAARTEALVERGAEDRRRNAFVDGRGDGPAPFARIRYATR